MGHKTIGLTVAEDLRVCGDRDMLRSAIENVLRNAVRFAPDGSTIDVAVQQNGNSALVSVADRGQGVAEDNLPRIFEPFFRADASNGAGLGLSIARRIIDLHGGRITPRNRALGGFEMELLVPYR
jgi:signal transduction histidine kinase